MESPFEHPNKNDHAAVRVIPGVKEKGFERSVWIPLRGRNPADHGLDDVVNPLSCFSAGEDRLVLL